MKRLTRTIRLDEFKIGVELMHYDSEKRNTGHPDNRLPDTPEEIEIISASILDVDFKALEERILALLAKEKEDA